MENSNPAGESDPFDLARFVAAQEGSYEAAAGELAAGRKRTHWMWYIFPQIAGLGFSSMSQRYAIGSLDEARAYLAHPVLGQRLVRLNQIVNNLEGGSAGQIFGSPDDMKFRSSMTLFAQVSQPGSEFHQSLDKYFSGKPDEKTLEILKRL